MNAINVGSMSWYAYVQSVAPDAPQKTLAAAAGVDGSTVSRWKNGFAPKPENVAAFARAYNRPVLEAFVAAGFLTAEEAKMRPAGKPQVSDLDSRELLAEVERRMGLAQEADLDDPAHYGEFGLAAHPPMETEHEKYERLHGDRGEENQDPDH